MGWNYEKNTRWEKNDELFADSVFDGDLVGLRKNGWILAIRRKSKAKRPHLPENKEKGSRKSLRVCYVCRGCGLYGCRYTKLLYSFFLIEQCHHTFPTQDKIVSGGNSKNAAILSMGSPALNILDAVFIARFRSPSLRPSCFFSYPNCSTAFS